MPSPHQYDPGEIDPVLRTVANLWKTKLEKAKTHKLEVFGRDAAIAYEFYSGPRNWDELMLGSSSGGFERGGDGYPNPTFKMSVNKTFEFVSIFGPALYYENPVRTVKPRSPIAIPPEFFADPGLYMTLQQQEVARVMTDTLRAQLLGGYLNWTPNQGLADESRLAIDEALITGRGCAWTELYEPPASGFKTVRTVYDSVHNLLVDPDSTRLDDAQWIARKCVHPTWEVERRYDLRSGSIKGNLESQGRQGDVDAAADGGYQRRRGLTNDLVVYYKIWSKMGLGGRLSSSQPDVRPALEMFGDYCYLVIADNVPFPLNLGPDLVNEPGFAQDPDRVFGATSWPTPYWAADEWPVSALDFHPIHNCPWPMAHIKAGMGELRFLNWVMSFLAGKMHTTLRDLIAIRKGAGEEIKETILRGRDLELLEIEADHQGAISELVEILQMPSVNGDVWRMIEAVENNFDKRVGLTELMYGAGTGGQTQARSATEVDIKQQGMNIRPQDMSRQVEAWQARIAAKEAITARYHLQPDDVRPVLGDAAAMAWAEYVASRDLPILVHQLEYHIEAGSTARPNKGAEQKQMTEAIQTLLQPLMEYAQLTGDLAPLNNLLADFAKSRDLDPARYQLSMAPQPPPAPGPQPGAGPDVEQATGNPIPQG